MIIGKVCEHHAALYHCLVISLIMSWNIEDDEQLRQNELCSEKQNEINGMYLDILKPWYTNKSFHNSQ